jgi:hypothetical protein
MIRIPRFLTLSALAILVLLTACGKDDPKPTEPNPTPGDPITTAVVEDSLQFILGDTLSMATTPLVCCGLYDPGFVNERAMRVVFYDAANQKPGWELLVLIDRAQQGEVATLPTSVVSPSKVSRISMFVPINEYSSDAQGSSGTITVHSFSCTSTAIQIHFSVDAVLHSEYWDGGSIRVQGTFHGTFPPSACSP